MAMDRLTNEVPPKPSLYDRLSSGELLFLTNVSDEPGDTTNGNGDFDFEELYEKFGREYVVVDLAMIDGEPSGVPNMSGIYVDAQRYEELYSV